MQPLSSRGSPTTISNRTMSSIWLLVLIGCGLWAQSEAASVAALSSRESPPAQSMAERVQAGPDGSPGDRMLERLLANERRKRSADLWPVDGAGQKRAHQRQQKLAADAAIQQQLSELIAQARNDKALERALLKMLISATLRPSGALPDSAEALRSPSAIDQLLASADQASREEQLEGGAYPLVRLIEYLEQVLARSPGFVDQSSSSAAALSSNELGQFAADGSFGLEKREFKPCSFNAISCAKNPFRTS